MIKSRKPQRNQTTLSPKDQWVPSFSSLSEMSSDEERAEEGKRQTDVIVKDVNQIVARHYSAMRSQPISPTQQLLEGGQEPRYNRLVAERLRKERRLALLQGLLVDIEKEKARLETDESEVKAASLHLQLQGLRQAVSLLETDDEKYTAVLQRCEATNEVLRYRSIKLTEAIDDVKTQIGSAEDVIVVDENATLALVKQSEAAGSAVHAMRQKRTKELERL